MKRIACILLALLALAGCTLPRRIMSKVVAPKMSLTQAIAGLESESLEDREAAAEALSELSQRGLSAQDGITALRAAAGQFPPREYDFQDSAADLVRAAAAMPQREYIALIVELYPSYGARARGEALALLAAMPEREAAVAYMDIVRAYARQGGVPQLRTAALEAKPRHPDVFFPALLAYADIPELEWDVYLLFLTYLQKGQLVSRDSLSYAPQVLRAYTSREAELMGLQQPSGSAWMWADDYQEIRSIAGLLLDLLGYFPAPDVKAALQRATSYADPHLKCFAVLSLVRQGQIVDGKHVLDVARSPEMRNHLYDELEKMGKRSLYPEAYRTQEAFAESDMVNWLTYPTELGCAPDEIELMKVVTIDTRTRDGLIDYYVFRFRTHEPHWAAEDGWMAGVSGPFIRKEEPTTNAYGDTFSDFEPWDSRTPEEHVGDIQEILDEWRASKKDS